jgi:MFS superfamily sulfate permease-like transporter
VVELIDRWAIVRLWRSYTAALGSIYGWVARVDLIAALAALFGVLIFDTLPGLFIGIVVSIILLVYRSSRPHVAVLGRQPGQHHWVDLDRHPDATTADGIIVLRPESGLFYANADNVSADVDTHIDQTTRAVVLDLGSVPVIDATAVDMLVELDDELRRRDIILCVARDIGQVRDVLATTGGGGLLEHVYPTADDAVRALSADSADDDHPEES